MNQQRQINYQTQTFSQVVRMNNGTVQIITTQSIQNPEERSEHIHIQDVIDDFLNEGMQPANHFQDPFNGELNNLISHLTNSEFQSPSDIINQISSLTNIDIDQLLEDVDQSEQEASELSEEEQDAIFKEQDCYICLETKKQFRDTCGEEQHQICSDCFAKLTKMSGCPTCRKDIKGVVGKQTIQAFFEDTNQSIYIDLYDIFLQQHSLPHFGQFNYYFNLHLGDINDLEGFLNKLIQRTKFVVSQICNSLDESTRPYIKLIKSIMKEDHPRNAEYIEKLNEFAKLVLYFF